jgi:hypothetical protein
MLNTHTMKRGGAPLWAFAAPLLGVPALVALLAVTAPKQEPAVDSGSAVSATTIEGSGCPRTSPSPS